MPLGPSRRHSEEAWQLLSALEDLSIPVKQILQSVENEEELEYLVSEQELSERLEWLFLDDEIADMLRHLIQGIKNNQIVPLISRNIVEEKDDNFKSEAFNLSSGKEDTLTETNNRIDGLGKKQMLLQLFKDRVQELDKKKEQLENLLLDTKYKSKQTLSVSNIHENLNLERNILRLDHFLCTLCRTCSSFEYFILDLVDMYKRQIGLENNLKGDDGNEWSIEQSLQQFYTQAKLLEDNIQDMQLQMIRTLTTLHKVHATQTFLVRRNAHSDNTINGNNQSSKRLHRVEKNRIKDLEGKVIQLATRNIRLQVRRKIQSSLEESFKKMMSLNHFYEKHLFHKKIQIQSLQLMLRMTSTRNYLLEEIRNQFELMCRLLEKEIVVTEDLKCHLNSSNGVQLAHMMERLYQNTMYRISKITGQSMSTMENIFQFIKECKQELDDAKLYEQNILKQSFKQMEEIQQPVKELLEMLQGAHIWEPSQHNGHQSYSQTINLLESKIASIRQDVNDILTTYGEQRKFRKSSKEKENLNMN
ncbi:hypothetical protein Gasu2_53670 [Galdieria sulphuraria]|nr:hypothetical protein Gasu2_53670 [Galdieria sulphuraria]